jgi:putative FmdB family regulatory protein
VPTYEYRCDACDRNFDVVQSFHDDPLTECPTCGAPVRKVFGNVGIVFKGSGFYKNDSRSGADGKKKTAESTAGSSPTSDSSSDSAGSDSAGSKGSGSSESSGGSSSDGGSGNAAPAKPKSKEPATS